MISVPPNFTTWPFVSQTSTSPSLTAIEQTDGCSWLSVHRINHSRLVSMGPLSSGSRLGKAEMSGLIASLNLSQLLCNC